MSKRRPLTEEIVQQWLNAGDGGGEWVRFNPFYHPRDVPSTGRSRLFKGVFVPRDNCVTLSDIEWFFHLLGEFAGITGLLEDLREQVALPWELSQSVARSESIRQPVFPGTRIPFVLTTDQVWVLRPVPIALNIKPASKLAHGDEEQEKQRQLILDKFRIEEKAWSLMGLVCVMLTDKMLPMNLVRNLDFTRPGLIGDERSQLNALIPDFVSVFCKKWAKSLSLIELLDRVSASLGTPIEDSMSLFSRAVWTRHLPVDIYNCSLHHEEPVTLVPPQLGESLWQQSLSPLLRPQK